MSEQNEAKQQNQANADNIISDPHYGLTPQKDPPKRESLHHRLWYSKPVRYVRGVIAAFFSIFLVGVIINLYLIDVGVLRINVMLSNVRGDVQEALEYVFPEYYVSIGDLVVDPDVNKQGWFVIDKVGLNDPVNQRYIDISEIRLSPSFISMLLGRGRFHHIVIEQAEIDYKLNPPKQNQELGFPISGLDIPSSVLTKWGDLVVSDMVLRLVSFEDEQLFSVRDLQASLFNNADGYQARVGARQADTQEGSFVFNVERKENDILTTGFARNYLLDIENAVSLDFDINLDFINVPEFDTSTQADNISQPYQYLEDGKGLVRLKNESFSAEAHYEYDKENDALAIENMQLSLGEQNFEGNVEVKLGDSIIARGFDFAAQYEGREGPVDFDGGSFVARIDLAAQVIDIGELSFLNEYFHFFGNGQAKLQPQPQVLFDGHLDDIERQNIEALWPASLGDEAFNIFNERYGFSSIQNVDVWARYLDEFEMEMAGYGYDLDISAVDFLPAIKAEEAQLRVTQNDLLISTPLADLQSFEDDMDFQEVFFWIPSFAEKPMRGVMNFAAAGEVSALLEALNEPPLSVADKSKINTKTTTGQFVADFNVDIPFETGITFQDTGFQADGELIDLVLRNYVGGQDLRTPLAVVKMTQNHLNINGPVSLGPFSGNADYYQGMVPGSPPEISVNANVTPQMLRNANVTLPRNVEMGNVPIEADIEVANGGVNFAGEVNLREVGFSIAGVGRVKSRGTAGRAFTKGRYYNGGVTLDDIEVNAEGLQVSGNREANGQINLTNLSLDKIFRGQATINGNNISLRNADLDLTQYDFATAQADSGDAYNLNMENLNVRFQNGYTLTRIFGNLQTGKNAQGDVTGNVGGIAPMRAQIWKENDLYHAKIVTNDMGGAFRGLGLFQDIYGGAMEVQAKATGYPGIFAAKVDAKNFEVKNSSTAIKLLQAASIFGGLEGDQLSFESLNGDVVVQPNRIGLYSGYLYGPAIGITLGGAYFTNTKRADFFGVVTPAYLLNGAFQKIPGFGRLLGGNVGEGLFGVTYRIMGTSPNLSIQANPLSLLTPGITRGIWGNVPQAQTLKPEFRIDD